GNRARTSQRPNRWSSFQDMPPVLPSESPRMTRMPFSTLIASGVRRPLPAWPLLSYLLHSGLSPPSNSSPPTRVQPCTAAADRPSPPLLRGAAACAPPSALRSADSALRSAFVSAGAAAACACGLGSGVGSGVGSGGGSGAGSGGGAWAAWVVAWLSSCAARDGSPGDWANVATSVATSDTTAPTASG